MRSRRPLAPGPVAVLAFALVLATPAAASAGTAAAAATGGDARWAHAALGAVLGVLAFGVRQWRERPGRGRR